MNVNDIPMHDNPVEEQTVSEHDLPTFPRMSAAEERHAYQHMKLAVRDKLVLLTMHKGALDLLELLIEKIELRILKVPSLVHLLGERAYLSILHVLDALDASAHVKDHKAFGRGIRKLRRYLMEWAIPRYILESTIHEILDQTGQISCALKEEAWFRQLKREIKRAGSRYAYQRNQLATANLGLVYSISNRYRFLGLSYEDLVQEGSIGLLKAIERYDPERGYLFSTYAYKVVSQRIHLAIEQQSALVRKPFRQLREKAVVDQTRARLEQNLLRAPRGREFEEQLPGHIDDKKPHIAPNIQPTAHSDSGQVYIADPELHEEKERTDQDFDTHFLVHQDTLESALSNLEWRAQQILRMRYGIGVKRSYTLKEIAASFSLSTERTRQIALHTLERLQDALLTKQKPFNQQSDSW